MRETGEPLGMLVYQALDAIIVVLRQSKAFRIRHQVGAWTAYRQNLLSDAASIHGPQPGNAYVLHLRFPIHHVRTLSRGRPSAIGEPVSTHPRREFWNCEVFFQGYDAHLPSPSF